MKKIFVLILCTALSLSPLYNTVHTDAASQKILGRYSNLVDKKTQFETKKALLNAGIPEKNIDTWLKDVNNYNNTIKNTSLVKSGYKALGTKAPVYNDNKISELWTKKYKLFIGYNCRITAFELMKNLITADNTSKPNTTELFMDIDALKNSPDNPFNKTETKKFENLYSTVDTDYTTNINKHVANWKKMWKNKNISISKKTKASLITVVFHSSFSETENELFVGHAGVLVPLKNKKYLFIEKLSFQSPYQVIKFDNKKLLNEYLMRMYDTEWGQDTAKPFIMENTNLLSCYKAVKSIQQY